MKASATAAARAAARAGDLSLTLISMMYASSLTVAETSLASDARDSPRTDAAASPSTELVVASVAVVARLRWIAWLSPDPSVVDGLLTTTLALAT